MTKGLSEFFQMIGPFVGHVVWCALARMCVRIEIMEKHKSNPTYMCVCVSCVCWSSTLICVTVVVASYGLFWTINC